MDLALNNLQRLVCHKTKPNQTKLGKAVIYIVNGICNSNSNAERICVS